MKHKKAKKSTLVFRKVKKYLPLGSIILLLICGLVTLTKTTQVDGLGGAVTTTSKKLSTKNAKATTTVALAAAQQAANTAANSTTAKKAAGSSAASSTTSTASSSTATAAATQAAASAKAAAPIATASPRGLGLYVDQSLTQLGRPAAITSQPSSTWLGGWSGNVQVAANSVVSAAVASGKIATLVAYNIPGRDCGSYSSGGLSGPAAYNTWIAQLAAGIGQRQAIVILEPDALAQISCLSTSLQNERYAMLSNAVSVLTSQTKAFIYLDAGNSSWIDASTMATSLQKANIAQARGFSLNVSNFFTTSSNTAYGNIVAGKTGKSFVIDTSRNGKGPTSDNQWCNPAGRGLGARPTTTVGGNVDAYLWVKAPGESDGDCNRGEPAAGVWWEQYAESLVNNS